MNRISILDKQSFNPSDFVILTKDSPIVFFTIDKNYLVPAAATIQSVLNAHSDLSIKIYLVISGQEDTWMKPLVDMIQRAGKEVSVKKVNLEKFQALKINFHFSEANYFRLIAAELFEETRIIYLDSDILLRQDLLGLWQTDLGNFPLAAVRDFYVKDYNRLGLSESEGYFNSGIMLLNLDQWRKMNLGKKVLDFIRLFPQRIQFADQCGLNGFLKGNWLAIHPKWNVQSEMITPQADFLDIPSPNLDLVEEAVSNPAIIHFTGPYKPWNLGCSNPYKKIFWETLQQTPLRKTLPLDFSVINLLKSLLPRSMKKYYWRQLGE